MATRIDQWYACNAMHGKGGAGAQVRRSQRSRKRADVHIVMTWAKRLKRVFNIDVTTCGHCGGVVKIIACIEDPLVIKRILDHLDAKTGSPASINRLPEPRAPPQAEFFV